MMHPHSICVLTLKFAKKTMYTEKERPKSDNVDEYDRTIHGRSLPGGGSIEDSQGHVYAWEASFINLSPQIVN